MPVYSMIENEEKASGEKRTSLKGSHRRVHSRRKNRIAIVDNKIMMTKTTSSRSSSCSIGSGNRNRKMSSVSFTSIDFFGEAFVDFVLI